MWKPGFQIVFFNQLVSLIFPDVVCVFDKLAECVTVEMRKKVTQKKKKKKIQN